MEDYKRFHAGNNRTEGVRMYSREDIEDALTKVEDADAAMFDAATAVAKLRARIDEAMKGNSRRRVPDNFLNVLDDIKLLSTNIEESVTTLIKATSYRGKGHSNTACGTPKYSRKPNRASLHSMNEDMFDDMNPDFGAEDNFGNDYDPAAERAKEAEKEKQKNAKDPSEINVGFVRGSVGQAINNNLQGLYECKTVEDVNRFVEALHYFISPEFEKDYRKFTATLKLIEYQNKNKADGGLFNAMSFVNNYYLKGIGLGVLNLGGHYARESLDEDMYNDDPMAAADLAADYIIPDQEAKLKRAKKKVTPPSEIKVGFIKGSVGHAIEVKIQDLWKCKNIDDINTFAEDIRELVGSKFEKDYNKFIATLKMKEAQYKYQRDGGLQRVMEYINNYYLKSISLGVDNYGLKESNKYPIYYHTDYIPDPMAQADLDKDYDPRKEQQAEIAREKNARDQERRETGKPFMNALPGSVGNIISKHLKELYACKTMEDLDDFLKKIKPEISDKYMKGYAKLLSDVEESKRKSCKRTPQDQIASVMTTINNWYLAGEGLRVWVPQKYAT